MKTEIKINNNRIIILIVLIFVSLNLHSQFENFAESYGVLSTIAGKGEMDNSGEVGWLPEFEYGAAIDAELTRPHFAMADSFGNVYIADKDAHGIRKVTPDGIIYTIAGINSPGDNGDGLGIESQLNSPNGIWVKADGTVYILDIGNDKIRRLDTAGNLITIVDDPNGIGLGRGLWVTPSEDTIFYASGSQIKMWTKENDIVIYSTGYRGLGNITMDKNGFLVATDRTANLVYRISKDGSTKEIIAGNASDTGGGDDSLAIETGLDGVRGVWFLDDNSYFVATHEGSQIWYIDNDGRIHLFLNGMDGDEYHSGDGENYRTPGYKISEPRSVSVDYEGNVLIVENDKGFIRKIENDYTYYYTNIINNLNQVNDFLIYPNPATSETYVHYRLNKPGLIS
ncbi:hypothetical protein ACFLTE_02930, partial [Bacteroidota bacterium]